VHDRPAADKAPNVGIEAAELFLHGQIFFRVINGRKDLCLIANDPCVFEQRADLPFPEPRDSFRVEIGESLAVSVTS
jgi:hypothetical protein